MDDSQDEIQILNQRKIQKHLFDTQENNDVLDFTILNNRHEESIVQGDENSKEYDKGIDTRNESYQLKNIYYNNNTSINNLIHKISEQEEQKYDSDKDTNLIDETVQIQNEAIQIQEVKSKQQEINVIEENSSQMKEQIIQIDQSNGVQVNNFESVGRDQFQISSFLVQLFNTFQ